MKPHKPLRRIQTGDTFVEVSYPNDVPRAYRATKVTDKTVVISGGAFPMVFKLDDSFIVTVDAETQPLLKKVTELHVALAKAVEALRPFFQEAR